VLRSKIHESFISWAFLLAATVLCSVLLLVGLQVGKSSSFVIAANFRQAEQAYPLCFLDPLCVSPTWHDSYELRTGAGIGWFSGQFNAKLWGLSVTDLAAPNYCAFILLATAGVVISIRITRRPRRRIILVGIMATLFLVALGWCQKLATYNPEYGFANSAELGFIVTTTGIPLVIPLLVARRLRHKQDR